MGSASNLRADALYAALGKAGGLRDIGGGHPSESDEGGGHVGRGGLPTHDITTPDLTLGGRVIPCDDLEGRGDAKLLAGAVAVAPVQDCVGAVFFAQEDRRPLVAVLAEVSLQR